MVRSDQGAAMPNRLNFPGYTVLSDPVTDAIHATYDELPDTCPECGVIGRLHRWGKRDMTITDTVNFGERTRFTVTRVRLKCMECGHTFMQPLPGIDDRRRLTVRAMKNIAERGLRHPYALLAEEYDLDPKTISAIVMEHGGDSEFPPWAPHYLGIDEVKVDGVFCAIFTDIGNRKIIDFLPNRRKTTVKRWLRQLESPERIQAVTIDMWKDYRESVYEVLGERMPIVIDKYHVTSKADKAVEAVRVKMNRDGDPAVRKHMKGSREILTKNPAKLTKDEKSLLGKWLRDYPILKTARDTSGSFKRIYNVPTRWEAESALDDWLASIPEEVADEFVVLVSAVTNWRYEIMNYFEHRITNAFTEAMNKKVKTIAREGSGYDFVTMRRRILEGYNPKPARGFMKCSICYSKSTTDNPVKMRMVVPPLRAALHLKRPKPIRMCNHCYGNHRNEYLAHGIFPTTKS
jgi:transposase